jgi:hypothetical protein
MNVMTLADGIQMEQETLSDGSKVYNLVLNNVVGRPSSIVRMGCESEEHAHVLADALARISWLETDV